MGQKEFWNWVSSTPLSMAAGNIRGFSIGHDLDGLWSGPLATGIE